ncbi:MAG: sel1 repeat family protein [Deltaproteobacteria bacterium]|jgi:TPR repeat protein|nr:sel1 repeat family protein [Deltaproteobacteria bacterium]
MRQSLTATLVLVFCGLFLAQPLWGAGDNLSAPLAISPTQKPEKHFRQIKDERVRRNVIQALQIVISSLNDIIHSNDRVVVTNISDNILKNLNQKEIDYNFEVIDLYNSIIYSLEKFRLDNERLDLFQYLYDHRTLKAFALTSDEAGPIYGWLDYLAPAFRAILADFLDYGANVKIYQKSLGRGAWELNPDDNDRLTKVLEIYLARAWSLLEAYSTSADPKLTKKSLTKFGEILSLNDPEKIVTQLQTQEKELGFYPPYWFFLGYNLNALDRLDEAAKIFQKFETVWRPVLLHDGLRADVAKYCLLEAIRQNNKADQIKFAELIAQNADKDAWLNLLLAGLVFDELGDQAKAEVCFQTNLNNGRGLLASSLALNSIRHGSPAAEGLREFVDKKPYFDDGAREIVIIKESAAAGNPIAQYSLGFMFQVGLGVDKDLAASTKWYRLASDQGYASAQTALATLLLAGQGTGKISEDDEREAFNLFKTAADQGDATAQTRLGLLYFAGLGVKRDKTEGVVWLRLAAEQGDPEAQFALGGVYFRGNGAPMNKVEGLKWLRLAAEKGHIDAQFELGSLFERGEETLLDKEEAAKWFGLAAAQGHHEAHDRLLELNK